MNSVSLKLRPELMPIIFLGLASCLPAHAGVCRVDTLPGDYRHEFQLFAGYSPASSTLIGTTTDRQFVSAGFEYSYRCWPWGHISLSFTPGIMPAAILIQPAETFLVSTGAATSPSYQIVPSHAVYGFAVTPVGFTVDFGRTRRIYPFIETNEGIIASTQPIPLNITNATALNFLIDLGGGIKWRVSEKPYLLTFGYKFLHISNAFTTPVNPGVDNNVFYLGFSFLHR